MTRADQNAETVRRLVDEVWNAGDPARLDAFLAPDFEDEAYSPPNAQGHKAMVATLRDVIPDARWTIERLTAGGDAVVCELRLTGTHQGAFRGIAPQGFPIDVRAYRTFLFVNGRIRRHAALLDTAGLLRQMAGAGAP